MSTPESPPLAASLEYTPSSHLQVVFYAPGREEARGVKFDWEPETYHLGRDFQVSMEAGSFEPGIIQILRFNSLPLGMQVLVRNLMGPTLTSLVDANNDLEILRIEIPPDETPGIRQAWIAISRLLNHM